MFWRQSNAQRFAGNAPCGRSRNDPRPTHVFHVRMREVMLIELRNPTSYKHNLTFKLQAEAMDDIDDRYGRGGFGDRTVTVREARQFSRDLVKKFVDGYDWADLMDQVETQGNQIRQDGRMIDQLLRSQRRFENR